MDTGRKDRKEIDARLGELEPEIARGVLVDLLEGDISPVIALSRLLLALGYVSEVDAFLAEAAHNWGRPLDAGLYELSRLLQDHREGCERVATMLREHPDTGVSPSLPEEAIASCRLFFDRAVQRSEVGSVAAYSLGDEELLDRATAEVVDLFGRWELLGPERRTLEIGCGIGRLQKALAPRVGEAHGIDISPKMIAAAKRRCKGLPNVHLAVSSGRDLAGFAAESLDLVFAVDSFPYVFQAGPEVAEAHFHEAARVLRGRGDLVIVNYSYRDSLAADRADVRRLARAAGFDVLVAGAQPFTFWDGVAFRMRRS